MSTTLAEVLRRFGPEYLREHGLSSAQAKAWRAIVACRTAALGGERLRCDDCGTEQWRWHSCRNRHCPQCQTRQRDAWRRARGAELLNVPYSHMVFTLPHELIPLVLAQPRWVYDTLLQVVATTLTQFAADPKWLGGQAAFTLVLHTWTQDLRLHPHVHALVSCGALARDAQGRAAWQAPRRSPTFLFPVRALSLVFRTQFVHALQQAQARGQLRCPIEAATAAALRSKPWVVYAKTPLAGPAAVLDYLSRYTHRTAIGNERLLGIHGDQVCLKTRINQRAEGVPSDQPRSRICRLQGAQFIGRFIQHVLPQGFKRIRHYGLLASANKTRQMDLARAALHMPTSNPRALEDVAAFMRRVAQLEITRCPHCQHGRWHVVECLAPATGKPVSGTTHSAVLPNPRGPPWPGA